MASRKIRLVKGDERPIVTLTLRDEVSDTPIDLSSPTTTVQIKFRRAGSTGTPATIACEKVGTGASGQVTFKFVNGELDGQPGDYEGEIEIDYAGEVQTVYDLLEFDVRDTF